MKKKLHTYFDRFDICEAYYLYANHYHEGQNSEIYKIFGRLEKLRFKPSPALTVKSLTKNGARIYSNLKRTHAKGSR